MNSMTGFGRGSAVTDAWLAKVELSTVNRKQAEVVVQLPRELAEMDGRIRKLVHLSVSRGRVQVNVSLEPTQGAAVAVRLDTALANSFEAAFTELSGLIGREVRPSAADFIRHPGMLTIGSREIDAESAWNAIQPALDEALAQLTSMRRREGSDLLADIEARLDTLGKLRQLLADAAQERPSRQRELLLKRLREAGLELDLADERVLKELALFADRCDITEELTRLDSHCSRFREYLHATDPPGRALDFLCQEIFREFNTIGAKANAAAVAQTIVEAKTDLEKIRELVQNVE